MVIDVAEFIKCQTERAAHNNAESQCNQSIRPHSLGEVFDFFFFFIVTSLANSSNLALFSSCCFARQDGRLFKLWNVSRCGRVIMTYGGSDVTWKPQWDVKALLRRWNLKPATYISYTYNEDLISLMIFTSDCSNSPACFWSCQNQ